MPAKDESAMKQLCCNVHGWNVTTTIVATLFLIVGTLVLTQTCYVPDNGASSANCAGQTSVLLYDSSVLVALVAVIALCITLLFQILVLAGCTCDGWCNNQRHTVVLSIVTFVAAVTYANFVQEELDKLPTSQISDPDACLVCPHGKETDNLLALWIGPVVAFFGVAATMWVSCFRQCFDDDVVSSSLHEQLETCSDLGDKIPDMDSSLS